MEDGKKIGIIGGGQLGRMMTVPAHELGFKVTVLDPTPNCPAAQMGAEQVIGGLTEAWAIKELADRSDIITWEIEHINTGYLRQLKWEGASINPSPDTLEIIKDKLTQKIFLQERRIPVAPFSEVVKQDDLSKIAASFRYPFLLKSRFGGYDGRGNALVRNPQEAETAWQRFAGEPLYAEKYVPFEKELAIMMVRELNGDIVSYDVVETIHKNNICHTVIAPAPIDGQIRINAQRLGEETMDHLDGAGVFGIEMFLDKDGNVLVNEIAPRVHNSGHYTTEACYTSQFENHIRAITGLPLGSTEMRSSYAVMINILGDRTGPANLTGLDQALEWGLELGVHIYGKAETKPERKMGHLTVTGDSLDYVLEAAKRARSLISI